MRVAVTRSSCPPGAWGSAQRNSFVNAGKHELWRRESQTAGNALKQQELTGGFIGPLEEKFAGQLVSEKDQIFQQKS